MGLRKRLVPAFLVGISVALFLVLVIGSDYAGSRYREEQVVQTPTGEVQMRIAFVKAYDAGEPVEPEVFIKNTGAENAMLGGGYLIIKIVDEGGELIYRHSVIVDFAYEPIPLGSEIELTREPSPEMMPPPRTPIYNILSWSQNNLQGEQVQSGTYTYILEISGLQSQAQFEIVG